jgi:hypothetical protein
MKIKVSKLANSIPSIKFISQQTVPAKICFKLAKFINAISQELDVLEQSRKMIVEKYSFVNKETEQFDIKPENQSQFEKEMLDLFNEEVEISLEPIQITELGGISLPVNHLMSLDFMFTE